MGCLRERRRSIEETERKLPNVFTRRTRDVVLDGVDLRNGDMPRARRERDVRAGADGAVLLGVGPGIRMEVGGFDRQRQRDQDGRDYNRCLECAAMTH